MKPTRKETSRKSLVPASSSSPQQEPSIENGRRGSSLSPEISARAVAPSRLGDIAQPDGYAYLRGDCGDSLEVFLDIRDRRVRRARFDALGCEYTVACGNVAMELAEGSVLREALAISPEEISRCLGGLPPSHLHCAELAAQAVRSAVEDYLRRGGEPWKKLYRTRTPEPR
mgnify:CR=1 FL=1